MSLAYTSLAVAVLGIGVSAYSSYEQGQSAKDAADYNAAMSDRAALESLQKGAIEAAHVKERTRKLIASQVAASGAAGFDSTSGTPLDLSVEAAGFGELDALTTINNAQRGASAGFAQGQLDRYQGKMSSQAGSLNAAGTVLQGSGNAYYGFKKGQLADGNRG